MEETQNILQGFAGSKGTFVILYIDLVESTNLSMILPVESLTTIIRAFTQEMSMMIALWRICIKIRRRCYFGIFCGYRI